MFTHLAKSFVARLPPRVRHQLRVSHFARQLARGTFETDEAEFARLAEFVAPGDWVIDIGANVGHYTRRLSELVGPEGRVLAFEPVPDTFNVLSSMVLRFPHQNVTLFNVAASDVPGQAAMSLPRFDTGLTDYYQASLGGAGPKTLKVLTLLIDGLHIDRPVSLVKIDAEGHERAVIAGMRGLLRAHRPVVVLETGDEQLLEELADLGYGWERAEGSSNVVLTPVLG